MDGVYYDAKGNLLGIAPDEEEQTMSELDKLEQYLKDHRYRYERKDKESEYPDGKFNWHQIRVYDHSGEIQEWDAICHYGSYGYEQGLLEIMGSITGDSDVIGWLTAEEVIERLSNE